LLDARCVISVPGQTFEVPALFMAWMFDEPEMKSLKNRKTIRKTFWDQRPGSNGEGRSHCSHQAKENDDASRRSHFSI
jgi:hypothetical protein